MLTGCVVFVMTRLSLTGEPDGAGGGSGVSPRCSSASLNDNFVDIGQFHKFAANRVEAGPSKSSWFQSFDMSVIQSQGAIADRSVRKQPQITNRSRDNDDDFGMIDILDLDENLVRSPNHLYANSALLTSVRHLFRFIPIARPCRASWHVLYGDLGKQAAVWRACLCDHDFERVTLDVRALLGFVVVGFFGPEHRFLPRAARQGSEIKERSAASLRHDISPAPHPSQLSCEVPDSARKRRFLPCHVAQFRS